LKGPVAIKVTKSEVAVLYPLSYLAKWVPYRIYEEAVNASNCNAAGAYPTPVTCGWSKFDGAYDLNSQVQLFLSSDEKHKYASVILQCLYRDATAVASPILLYVTKMTLYLQHLSFVLRLELVSSAFKEINKLLVPVRFL
jgi:hypothetical protein